MYAKVYSTQAEKKSWMTVGLNGGEKMFMATVFPVKVNQSLLLLLGR
jgi:hypothetical protein